MRMGTGYFGLALGKGLLNGVFLGSLIPHVSYGIVLGLLLEWYLVHRGTIVALIQGAAQQPSFTHILPARPYDSR